MTTLGLLLAAGAGRRMGRPKALLRDSDGTGFLARGVTALRRGGCEPVLVVLGASADEAAVLLQESGWSGDPSVWTVRADDWPEGMGASLRAGLDAARGTDASAALVTLVDLPDVDERVVDRILRRSAAGPGALARASYAGRPGHPVLIGRDHWTGVAEVSTGDRGARDYLAAHPPTEVECGDLATGRDTDTPDDLDRC